MTAPRLAVVGATGWFGRTLIHEYVREHGASAASNLALYASRRTTVTVLTDADSLLELDVLPLQDLADRSLDGYEGLFWYSFLLRNLIPTVGLDHYRATNEAIACLVFDALDRSPELPCIFASSGAALELDSIPSFGDDPYAHLKLVYEQELRKRASTTVVYPYAVTGLYVPNRTSFALGSLIWQALTSDRVRVETAAPVLRSYGSVHDLSRYLLAAAATSAGLPRDVVPVTCTLDLVQLAVEVCAALGSHAKVECSQAEGNPDVYVSTEATFGRQLVSVGLAPTPIAEQIRLTARGPVFRQA